MKQPNNRFIHRNNKTLDKNTKLSVLLLCSNMGYRTKSFGSKSLIPTSHNKVLLQHQIDCIKNQYSNVEIVTVIGYEADKIIKKKTKGCRFVENIMYETTGDYESIRIGLNNIEHSNVLILNGDLYFNHSTVSNIVQNYSYIQLTKNENSKLEVGVNELEGDLSILSYGLKEKYWTELAYFVEPELNKLKDIVFDRNKNKLLFMEAINEVIEKGGQFKTCSNNDSSLFKIETITDIKAVKIV